MIASHVFTHRAPLAVMFIANDGYKKAIATKTVKNRWIITYTYNGAVKEDLPNYSAVVRHLKTKGW